MKKVLFTYFFLIPFSLYSQVKPPNYDFSLDNLAPYYPGKDLKAALAQNKTGKLDSKSGDTEIWKFYVEQIRYRFPLFAQVYNGKILDFYTTLPTYFLHDLFHQSLINRYKKQDSYQKIKENAIYTWKNAEGNKVVYSGTCTITCFPLYLSISTNSPPTSIGSYEPVYQKFVKNSPDKMESESK